MSSLSKTILKLFLLLIIFGSFGLRSHAQEIIPDKQEIWKAKVTAIISEGKESLPGVDVKTKTQKIEAIILEGPEKDKTVTLENDYTILKKGEIFYLSKTTFSQEGTVLYDFSDSYRLPWLLVLALLFIVLVAVFGGIQGLRGLVTLAGSFILIIFVLLPQIIKGVSPLLLSIGVSSLIVLAGSYITHGFNKTTTSAVIGMVSTLIITGVIAYFAVHLTHLTGYSSEEVSYLNINSRGHIDLLGLLFGGIMIGLLGVLYDSAIGQAVAVDELHHVGPHVPRSFIFKRAIRIGREHIGALVNTLAIAYVGASLPLLLLFTYSDSSIAPIINREIFATEIVRILVGSIGIILAVPITTWVATLILVKKTHVSKDEIAKEEEKLKHYNGHHH